MFGHWMLDDAILYGDEVMASRRIKTQFERSGQTARRHLDFGTVTQRRGYTDGIMYRYTRKGGLVVDQLPQYSTFGRELFAVFKVLPGAQAAPIDRFARRVNTVLTRCVYTKKPGPDLLPPASNDFHLNRIAWNASGNPYLSACLGQRDCCR